MSKKMKYKEECKHMTGWIEDLLTNIPIGAHIRVKKGWHEYPKTGICLGKRVFIEQWWVPVKWDDEDDPDFFKQSGVEVYNE